MNALAMSLGSAASRGVMYRAQASSAMAPSSGGGAASQYGSAGARDPWEQAESITRLYAAAARGTAFSAIRPVCVKLADLAIRVGSAGAKISQREMRIREKAWAGSEDLAAKDLRHAEVVSRGPAFVKSLSMKIDVVEEHPFLDRMASPNEFQTGSALIWCTAFSLCACGESIWLLDWDDQSGDLAAVYYLPRHWVLPVAEGRNPFAKYKLLVGGRQDDSPPIDGRYVVHVMTPNAANPATSYSSTAAQSMAIATDEEIQRAQLSVTKNITKPGMLVVMGDMDAPTGHGSHRPELTADQRRDLTAQIRHHYQTAVRMGDPLILDRLISDVRPYMPQPSDLDYQGGSAVIADRVYQGYGTNPIVAGQVQNGNRAQALVAHESMDWLQVNPLATLISESMTAKIGSLYSGDSGSKLVIWFDPAKARDPELMHKRFAEVAKYGVLTKGQLREYLATGEYEYKPQEDDDEPAKPAGPASPGAGDPNQAGAVGAGDPAEDPNAVNPPPKKPAKPAKRGQPAKRGGKKRFLARVPSAVRKNARTVLRWLREGALDHLDAESLRFARVLASGEVRSLSLLRALALDSQRFEDAASQAAVFLKSSERNAWESAEVVGWMARGASAGSAWALAVLGLPVEKNCGTGAGGFKTGNSCAGGSGGIAMASQAEIDKVEKLKDGNRDAVGVLKTAEYDDTVPVSAIRATQETSVPHVLADYRQKVRNGEDVTVGKDGGLVAATKVGDVYYLEDGHHRARAMVAEGFTEIPLKVRDLSSTKNVADSCSKTAAGNCGTGAGGFKPGNTCASGGGSDAGAAGGGDVPVVITAKPSKPLAPTKYDTSKWPAHNSAAQWAAKKIAVMEKMAADGNHADLLAIDAYPKSKSPNPYQKAVFEAHKNLVAGIQKTVDTPPAGVKLASEASKAAAVAAKPELKKFPGGVLDATSWKKEGGALGSNDGSVMTANNGDKYYVKTPTNVLHARSEITAAKLYDLAGAGIPKVDPALAKNSSGQQVLGVASKWDADIQKFDVNNPGHVYTAQKDFAVHAWLGNWDSVGLAMDNVGMKVTPTGLKSMCIDAGGCLEFRAQGGAKVFGPIPAEWETLRDPSKASKAAQVFGSMTPDQLQASAAKLANIKKEDVAAIVTKHYGGTAMQAQDMVDTLMARRDHILAAAGLVPATKTPDVQAGVAKEKPVSVEVPHAVAPPVPSVPKAAPAPKPGVESVTPSEKAPPMALPAPPLTSSVANQSANAKFQKMFDAAKAGDVGALNAIPTTADAKQTYAKKAHQYKMQLLAALGGSSAVAASPHPADSAKSPVVSGKVVKAEHTKPPFEVDVDALPAKPSFLSKKWGEQNGKDAAKLESLAKSGDLDSLKAATVSGSPKLVAYHAALIESVSSQIQSHQNWKPPVKMDDLHGALEDVSKSIGVNKNACEKCSTWSIVGATIAVPTANPVFDAKQTPKFWLEGKATYDKMSVAERESLLFYTSSGYKQINAILRGDKGRMEKYGVDSDHHQLAKDASNSLMRDSLPLASGTALSRKHQATPNEVAKLKASVGKVMQDKGVLSTATDPTVWSGNVHWQMVAGPGVRGLPAKLFSSAGKHEAEVLLPPNQRMLITSVEQDKYGQVTVKAYILPTVKEQCCPP